MSVVDERRELVREIEEHPLVGDVDFTRDGFQTVIVHMAGGSA